MKRILILFILLAFLVYPASAEAPQWIEDSSIVSGFDGDFYSIITALSIFNDSGTLKSIVADNEKYFHGYEWNGTGWENTPSLISGLPDDVGTDPAPEIFYMDNKWILIIGNIDTMNVYGYEWNGTTWQSNSTLVSGLQSIGWSVAPAIFNNSGTWYLISGDQDGIFHGFRWTGSAWVSDTAIISGLPADIGSYSTPTVFNDAGTWKLITGERHANFYGYNWTGTTWQSDPAIISGLENWAYYGESYLMAKPEIFNDMGTLKLIIAIDSYDNFYGFEWYVPPTTSDDLGFTATITNSQNTALLLMNTSFGYMFAGDTLILSPSFNLTNSGNLAANVTATFTSEYDGVYGFNGTTSVIGGSNFSMQSDGGTWSNLDNLDTGTELTDIVIADDSPYNWNARLSIPAGYPSTVHIGTIELTFS